MIYILPRAKFTQTTTQSERGGRGRSREKGEWYENKYRNQHLLAKGGILQKKKKTQCNIFFKSRVLGRQEKVLVNIITSALRFIWTASRTEALWRGKQDVLAANITVKFQFYLRESSFIKSHDWNCMTGANILHPDRCVSLQMPFSCQQSLDELPSSPFVSLPARSHMPRVCLQAALHGLICGILTMRLIKRQSIIFI